MDKAQEKSTNSNRSHESKFKEKYDLPLSTQKFVLQMSWAQHDGQWFLKSKKELGSEQANRLNQIVLLSIGKIEARHVLNALNIQPGTIKTMHEIFKIMNTIMHTYFPEVMKFKFVINSENEGLGIVKRCFIWDMVQRSKGESEYVCACNFRHRGWLAAMGVKGTIIPVSRISDGDERCEFKFVLETGI